MIFSTKCEHTLSITERVCYVDNVLVGREYQCDECDTFLTEDQYKNLKKNFTDRSLLNG